MASKILSPNKTGTIANEVLTHALEIGTPWTDEVSDDIGEFHGQGKWLKTLTNGDKLYMDQEWKKYDSRKQWSRLLNKVTKTTGLYKELNPKGEMPGPANYITLNPRSTDAIRHIFKLRSGASNLRDDKATRHLANTSTCRHCGEYDETARHIFDQCAALATRQKAT